MRGFPLLRAVLTFLAILALGYPLFKVTGAAESGATAPPAAPPALPDPKMSEVALQISFTSPPDQFVVQHLGREVWRGTGAAGAERTLRLPYPPEGIELRFSVEFPAGAPLAAARLILTDPAGDRHEKSCWGTGRIDEVVAFP